ncbi:uncharacterized protein N0V89_003102 [Didymosphaeria variabile]|uniref:Uncharacterized protein n=1 Tax=Didymosphaeria variabile TaxID=1932322 RepID=A0A9W8XVF9_9PLEO|nr:uncharacterized protein N0V89_003102 [Didymosphaeria variabile]KAJ4358518.1 hypothetical protein N0V89_003102 [Didymosphaeria variabile]
MAATTAELARELSTIITSPYPVSLAKLAEICTKSDALTVRACIRQHPPCAIAKLASSLYDALPVWQCCVIIFRCLSQSLEFKNELLSRNPGLLDAVLTKANTSQQDFDQYHGLCIQLLADPLPEGVPLPASVRSFFLRVFEQASRKPNVQNLKPIYYMLTGACRGFLALLPPDARKLFDEQLCHILKAKVASENFMLLLWCFGVAILAEHPELIAGAQGGHQRDKDTVANVGPTVEWTTAAGRKLFESSNACKKTIHLACLSVIWAIRDGSNVPDDEALEGIRIATRALQLVDTRLLEQWANADMNAMNTVSKLWEKIQRCDIKPAIQCEVLYFYAVVAGASKLSPSMVELYEAALVNMNGWGATDVQKSLSFSLPLFACTPISGLPLQDWRGRLKNELENQASYQRDSLIRAVGQICHDLESRCDTIEGPLRVERERTTALEDELSRSHACVESLEQKRVDDSLFLGTLEAEKSRLERDNEDLHARLESLRMELEKSNSQADTALHEAAEAYHCGEMRLRSVILQHEENIGNHVKEQETLREKAASLEDELGKQEAERHELADQYNDLQTRFEKGQDALENQMQTNVRLEDRCNDLQDRLLEAERKLNEGKQSTLHKEEEMARIGREAAALESDLQQTRADLATTTGRLDDLQVRHHELAQSSTKALQEVEAQCESDLEAAASKAAEEYHLLHLSSLAGRLNAKTIETAAFGQGPFDANVTPHPFYDIKDLVKEA